MKINTKQFLEQVNSLLPATSKTSNMPQADSIISDGDNRLITFNDEILMIVTVDYDFPQFTVNAIDLQNRLKSTKASEIEISFTKREMRISNVDDESQKTKLSIESKIMLPYDKSNPPSTEDWVSLPQNFIDGLTICETVCLKKASVAPLFAYIYIHDDYMYATDDERYIRFKMEASIGTGFVNSKAVKHIVKHTPVQILFSENWVYFKGDEAENCVMGVRTLCDENFGVLDEDVWETDGDDITFPDELSKKVDECSKFCEKEDPLLEFETNDAKLILTARKAKAIHRTSIDLTEPAEYKFAVAPDTIKRALKMTTHFRFGNDRLTMSSENMSLLVQLTGEE